MDENLYLTPGELDILIYQGTHYLVQGKPYLAIDAFKKALEIDPNNVVAHNGIGDSYLDLDKLDDAEKEFIAVINMGGDAHAHYQLGIIYFRLDNLGKAIEQFKSSIQINPNDYLPHQWLGIIYKKLSKLDVAIEEYKRSLEIKADASVHVWLGDIYREQDILNAAINEYLKALELDHNNPAARNGLGACYRDLDRFDEAIEEYKKAAELCPKDGRPHYWIGSIYYKHGKIDEALEQIKISLKLNPNDSWTHYMLGNIYYTQDKLVEAIEQYQKSVRLNPDEAAAFGGLGDCYRDLDKLDMAVEQYTKVLKLDSKNAHALGEIEKINRTKNARKTQIHWNWQDSITPEQKRGIDIFYIIDGPNNKTVPVAFVEGYVWSNDKASIPIITIVKPDSEYYPNNGLKGSDVIDEIIQAVVPLVEQRRLPDNGSLISENLMARLSS